MLTFICRPFFDLVCLYQNKFPLPYLSLTNETIEVIVLLSAITVYCAKRRILMYD